MAVRQVDRAGAEPHPLHGAGERGDEHRAGGDVLGEVGCVLTDITLDEAKLVGEQERLAVLAQRHPPVLADGVHGHCEETEFHVRSTRHPGIRKRCSSVKSWVRETGSALRRNLLRLTIPAPRA
jgi:hypothetical protein